MGQVSIKGKITEDIPSINGIAGHGQIDTSYDWEYPESNLSDYVFTLESSGGGAYADVAEYEDPADPTVNRSNIWVTNHTNVATGSTPTFSWTPDIVEIPDFYSANEMVIVGNDIYIVFRWAGYNKFLLAKGYYLAYNAGATNDTTGQPFSEIWPVDDGGPGAGDITHPDMYDEDGLPIINGELLLTKTGDNSWTCNWVRRNIVKAPTMMPVEDLDHTRAIENYSPDTLG